MLKVLGICKYQISREGYTKPDASSKVVEGSVTHQLESSDAE